jgi:hypothetical protein
MPSAIISSAFSLIHGNSATWSAVLLANHTGIDGRQETGLTEVRGMGTGEKKAAPKRCLFAVKRTS